MPASPENLAFSERLRSALKRLPKQVLTAAALAHEFNLRWDKGEPVTPQATRKWLSGEARPSVDKILSDWLGVSSHWLQYGSAAAGKKVSPAKRGQPGQLSESEAKLLARLRVLSEISGPSDWGAGRPTRYGERGVWRHRSRLTL